PQPDGGCDSSPPHGHGAKPSWCPAAAPQQLSSTAPAAENATGGKCCFNGCGDEDSCVTGYCGSRELCLKPQLDGGCDSSPPHGHGAKPSWCPAAAPQQLSSTAPAAENARGGKCCFNGCGDEDSCVTGYCGSRELCLKPQLDGGCDSSPPHGHGAKPSWCPAAAPQQLSSTAPAAENATGGKCCFNGCGDEDSCVTGYCGSRELCLKPQPDGGCDSSPPHGHGAKPSWCPAAAPQQLSSTAPAAENATGGKCCFNGCGDEDSCVTGYCGSRELCLKPQLDGGCDSSPPHGHGAKPSWCPAAAPQQLSSTAPAAENARGGKCCFNGCGDEDSCVTGYCALSPDAAANRPAFHGHGAKPSWCPAAAPQQLSSTAPAAENATGGKCCFNGCGDEDSCVTGYCGSRELCLKPQPDGGCDSSPPHGHGAKPSCCARRCCFNGCGDEDSCVTGYCGSRELCLKPQPDGGCDSSPPHGHGAKPSWCPADSCVMGYCGSRELCLKPQPDGGCDSSPPHGQGAKPSWCVW
ncbi:unnamed protein product, partial [Prorocentrum cordatum]